MAVDKLVDSSQLDSDLTSVANAIRTKGGTSASLAFPADFVSAIAAIPSGGGGSTSPLVSSTLSFSEATRSIQITLPHTVTNAVVQVEATASALTAMYAETYSTYRFVSGIFFYPTGDLDNGTKTSYKYGSFERYRPSTATFYAQHGATVSVSGTTLTLTIDSGTLFKAGADVYTVKVWEVATS